MLSYPNDKEAKDGDFESWIIFKNEILFGRHSSCGVGMPVGWVHIRSPEIQSVCREESENWGKSSGGFQEIAGFQMWERVEGPGKYIVSTDCFQRKIDETIINFPKGLPGYAAFLLSGSLTILSEYVFNDNGLPDFT